VIVCLGVIVLRKKRPDLHRPFRTPLYPIVPVVGVAACLFLIANLAVFTWEAFGVWLVIGLLIYFGYSRRHSALATSA
jgi:APA family basic amino acid/polyamine antiporter